MNNIIIKYQKPQVKSGYTILMAKRNAAQNFQTKGEVIMSKQEERDIYCRLAKEFIETRLDAKLTNCRVKKLADLLQAIDSGKYCCNNCQTK